LNFIPGDSETESGGSGANVKESESEQRIQDLVKTLDTEKASRTDLEMYVAVIETQKKVLQVVTEISN
jgi:hypothetical protein